MKMIPVIFIVAFFALVLHAITPERHPRTRGFFMLLFLALSLGALVRWVHVSPW